MSVLVQDAISQQPILDAKIRLSLKKVDPPSGNKASLCCQLLSVSKDIAPTRTQAHNKMLYTSLLSIPEPGKWELSGEMTHSEKTISFVIPLDIAPPQKPIEAWWPFWAMAPTSIGIYAWRPALVQSRRRQRNHKF